MKSYFRTKQDVQQAKRTMSAVTMAMMAVAVLAFPNLALAQFDDTHESVCGFFNSINGLLNVASIAVVTIAVIFAGYQIAFAHKRIADVAPILIGGLLIGAAAQIAGMLLPENVNDCSTGTTSALMMMLPSYA